MKLRCTSDDSNADALSRIPLREISAQTETPAELVLLIKHLQVPQSQPSKFKYGPEETLPIPQFYTIYNMVGLTVWLANQQNCQPIFPEVPNFQSTKDAYCGATE